MKTTITKTKIETTTGPRCHCGASLACWLCLGAGKLRANSARGIQAGDACHGCAGLGTVSCRPCLDKLVRKAAAPAVVRQPIQLAAKATA